MEDLILTNELVDSLAKRVNYYNKMHKERFVIPYQKFIKQREKHLKKHAGNLGRMTTDSQFIKRLHQMLAKFGLNARRSKLVNQRELQKSILSAKPIVKTIYEKEITLPTINLDQNIEGKPLENWIEDILSLLSRENTVTVNGGVVAASKTMHFLLPETFIMIDGSHIGPALNQIKDYTPDPTDGETWYDILPEYDGTKLNPKSRPAWDNPTLYLAALMYYKRVLHTWCRRFEKTPRDFLQLDPDHQVTATRIIDKALWWQSY